MSVSLDDKYTQNSGWVYLSGNQALVRLPIQQRLRDAAAGYNTGAYVSGYRGSPLGRYDMEMWRAQSILKSHNIHFRAAVNEDLAATALWGSQYKARFRGLKSMVFLAFGTAKALAWTARATSFGTPTARELLN
jgi:indolepyruvate ferredoxin oxidoreductase